MRLRPDGWPSGDQIWIVEVSAPFVGADAMVADLKEKVFPTRAIKMLVQDAGVGMRTVRVV